MEEQNVLQTPEQASDEGVVTTGASASTTEETATPVEEVVESSEQAPAA